ncbi:MAG: alpha/beta fold hydrolase, partial [Okeania sp. SIO3C4]|nr:alpha/beta fold hydrolase [Okeania sp. SIO3C4]
SSGGKTLVLFVHGYNTDFAEGLYRLAQMAQDYDIDGAAMAYSWPSAGQTPLYLYDRDSAQYARAGLVETIRLATETNADEVVLIGHSMGTIILMEALRELSLSRETKVMNRINAVILAAPDIDVDVFRTQIADVNPRPEAFAIFVSSRDRALRVSQRIRGGHPRLGEGTDITELQEEGIVVIDLSTVDDGGFSQHNTFASSPTMIALANSGIIGRQSLINQERGTTPIGAGVEGLFRLASDIVYLPATIVSQ